MLIQTVGHDSFWSTLIGPPFIFPLAFSGTVADHFALSVSSTLMIHSLEHSYHGSLTAALDWYPFGPALRGLYFGLYMTFPYSFQSSGASHPDIGGVPQDLLKLYITPSPSAWLGFEVGYDILIGKHLILELTTGTGKPLYYETSLTPNWLVLHLSMSLGYYW